VRAGKSTSGRPVRALEDYSAQHVEKNYLASDSRNLFKKSIAAAGS
jgi:hypothetical protein